MKMAKIAHAINEARRFIAAASEVQREEPSIYARDTAGINAQYGKAHASARRASLDLTNALAAMRSNSP